jgi:hypothetical protein
MGTFDPKSLQQAVDAAPEAGMANINFGKLSAEPQVATWSDGPEGGRVKTVAPWTGQTLTRDQSLEIKFTVNISELNPKLEFEYERSIVVRKSGRVKTDWSEIVEASLLEVFGKNWANEIAKSPYVGVEDFPNVAGNASKKGKVFGVPKFLAVYKSKEECMKAREDRYGKKADGGTEGVVAPGAVPQEVVNNVKALLASLGSEEQAMAMLAAKPFGNYDPAVLITLAKGTK